MKEFDSIEITQFETEYIPVPQWHIDAGYSGKQVTASVPASKRQFYDDEKTVFFKVSPKPDPGMPFWKIKQLGLIKMTPLSKSTYESQDFLIRLPRVSWEYGSRSARNPTGSGKTDPKRKTYFSGHKLLRSTYNEVYSFDTLVERFSNVPRYFKDDYEEDLRLAKNSVMSNVVNDSYSNFDALTNLAEGKESLQLVLAALKAAVHPLRGVKDLIERYKKARARGKSHREANDDISGQWMQYRYGIMPLVLSIQDALELMSQKDDEFKTSRSKDVIDLGGINRNILSSEPTYFFDRLVGSTTIRGTGKAQFDSSSLRLVDQITFNPFLTAWELIPMSFVIDWFVNVGDVIFSHTSTLVDASSQRKFCLSVKQDYHRVIYFKHDYTDTFKTSVSAWPSTDDQIRPPIEYDEEQKFQGVHLCRKEKFLKYDRSLFQPTDVSFEFLPSLSWRRWIDAYALSLNPTRKLLKKLRF